MEKFKLPEPFRTDWIKALRSGGYKQGKGCLYRATDDSYCCLGIAEKVCGTNLNASAGMPYSYQLGSISQVPNILKQRGTRDQLVGIVSRMNDSRVSFIEIADWLEANTEPE